MSHRLLHTLVFASTSLLACGGQIGSVTLESPEADPDAAPPDPPIDAGSDVRSCENGWPTTKGAICRFDAGIVCCKRSFGDAGEICCEKSQ